MARNWLTAFRPASFRGVPFKVDVEGAAGARRLSISPIAYSEVSVIEDMGREPRRLDIAAYVVGDVADAQAISFAATLDRKGAGLLVLPMLPPLTARVLEWRLSRELGRAGLVRFDVLFLEEGLSAVPAGALLSVGHFGDLMARGAAILGSAFR